MRVSIVVLGAWIAGCAGRASPRPAGPNADPRDETGEELAPTGELPDSPNREQGAMRDSDVEFDEDAVAPGGEIEAQPRRDPIGSFDLCGDKCRDNIELQESLLDGSEEDEKGEKDDAPRKKARRR